MNTTPQEAKVSPCILAVEIYDFRFILVLLVLQIYLALQN